MTREGASLDPPLIIPGTSHPLRLTCRPTRLSPTDLRRHGIPGGIAHKHQVGRHESRLPALRLVRVLQWSTASSQTGSFKPLKGTRGQRSNFTSPPKPPTSSAVETRVVSLLTQCAPYDCRLGKSSEAVRQGNEGRWEATTPRQLGAGTRSGKHPA